ncbi:hypothetical protein SAMN05216167_12934 [Spirosoma endophyticum]|uniref:Abortive infection C-terminus n=2 Tax=Spirosoma endophyticum TaxID=662367 RepID=A0A1I2G1R3_9BACT|nr:hypothetical protein SAMN05216167_12934 [Spirosoma endophyticum]
MDNTGYGPQEASKAYQYIHKALCKEYGVFTLNVENFSSDKEHIIRYLLKENNTEKVLDVVEVTFQYIEAVIPLINNYAYIAHISSSPDNAIEELNQRFKEHAIGYQYEASPIIRTDSTYTHSEIVKPALSLLSNEIFQGAFDEYTKAHEHYRHNRNKECLAECLKAFESTMKIICSQKKWKYDQKDTASKLIKACAENGLFQSFSETQLGSLKNLLEGGIPTIRNKFGGHGQGEVIQQVDSKLTRYCLNMTGTTIIFMIEQSNIK